MAIDPKSLPNDVDALKTLIIGLDQRYEQHLGEKQTLIDALLEQIRLHKHRQFKSKSEQLAQLALPGLFDEAEQLADDEEPPVDEPREEDAASGRRRKLPANLPRETIVHDLSDAEKSAVGPEKSCSLILLKFLLP